MEEPLYAPVPDVLDLRVKWERVSKRIKTLADYLKASGMKGEVSQVQEAYSVSPPAREP